MKLQSIAMRVTSRLKPIQDVTVINSIAYATGLDGSRIPVEYQSTYPAQVQSASGDTVREFAGTHSSGDLRVLYLKNVATMDNRPGVSSASVFVFDGSRWRVIRVEEDWNKDLGDWVRVLVVLQEMQNSLSEPVSIGNGIDITPNNSFNIDIGNIQVSASNLLQLHPGATFTPHATLNMLSSNRLNINTQIVSLLDQVQLGNVSTINSSSNVSVQQQGDPFLNNVVLASHLNGANGSTTIVGTQPITVNYVANGSAQIVTAKPTPFGTNNGVLSINRNRGITATSTPTDVPLQFINTDFSVETWVNFNSMIPFQSEFIITKDNVDFGSSFNSRSFRLLGVSVDGVNIYSLAVLLFSSLGGGSVVTFGNQLPNTVTTNQWFFLEWSRSGNMMYIFVDGVMTTSFDTTGHTFYESFQSPILLGGLTTGAVVNDPSNYMDGYLSDIRITKGIARHTSNYALPTQPYPV